MSAAVDESVNISLARRLVEIDAEQDDIGSKAAALRDERAEIEAQLIDQYAMAGVQSVRVDGRSVYLRHDTYAKILDQDKLIPVLRKTGHGGLIKQTVNSNTLSALCREVFNGENKIPKSWDGVLTVSDKFSIRVVKANK